MNVFCPKCGTASQSESKFCRECATPLPATPPPGATLPLPPMGPGASLSAAGISPADYAPGSMFAGRFQIIEALALRHQPETIVVLERQDACERDIGEPLMVLRPLVGVGAGLRALH